MSHNLPSELRHREGSCLLEDVDVGNQKPQRGIVCGDRPAVRAFEVGNKRRE